MTATAANPAIHLVQFDIAWEDKEANFARVESLLESATVSPGDLVVLPEMFDTGFSFAIERTADTDGRTSAFLSDLARRRAVYVHGALTVIREDGRGRNRCLVVDPSGAVVCSYDKIHPFSFGRESERFTGGSEVVCWDWAPPDCAVRRVCPAVCYDLRFPELFRHGLLQGAELIVIGANWPDARTEHWRTLLIARAIENQAFVVGVNRCGADPFLEYAGGSICVGPKGGVLVEAGAEECVLRVEPGFQALDEWRDRFPAWRDLKPGLLGKPEWKSGKSTQ